jgi:flagellar L-ring protein precursor FlgH
VSDRSLTSAVLSTLLAAVLLLTGGCMTRPSIEEQMPEIPDVPVPEANNGAIYSAGHDVALFENSTARNVGDIVTIRLVEATNASKSSSTTTSKSTSIDLPGPTIAGRPVTVNGTEILSASVGNETSFDGAGDSAQSNTLVGDITVAVVRRLANGNLVVRGQKWIGINQGKEYIKVEGVIRPIDIQPDNTIASNKVANAAIAYGGRGALADANKQSWLARFFNSPLLPF